MRSNSCQLVLETRRSKQQLPDVCCNMYWTLKKSTLTVVPISSPAVDSCPQAIPIRSHVARARTACSQLGSVGRFKNNNHVTGNYHGNMMQNWQPFLNSITWFVRSALRALFRMRLSRSQTISALYESKNENYLFFCNQRKSGSVGPVQHKIKQVWPQHGSPTSGAGIVRLLKYLSICTATRSLPTYVVCVGAKPDGLGC